MTGWELSSFGETWAWPPSTWCWFCTRTLEFFISCKQGIQLLALCLAQPYCLFFCFSFRRMASPTPTSPFKTQNARRRSTPPTTRWWRRWPAAWPQFIPCTAAPWLCTSTLWVQPNVSVNHQCNVSYDSPPGTSCCTTNNDVGQTLLHNLAPPKRYLIGGFTRPCVRGQLPLTNTLTDAVSHESL